MPKYLETAKEANNCATTLFEYVMDNISEDYTDREGVAAKLAEGLARLVNYGLRCAPRPVQSTVRLRAVQEAVRGLPVRVSMEKREDERTGKTYNVLVTRPVTAPGW